MEKRLYVGLDESNNGRKPLIIVSYFTPDSGQARFKKRQLNERRDVHSLRPSYDEIINFLKKRNSFLFIEDDCGVLGESGRHLVLATPILVDSFMKMTKDSFSGLSVFLDGPVKKEDKDFIYEEIQAGGYFTRDDISLEGVIKPKTREVGFRKNYVSYPDILIIPDGISHVLYAYPGLRKTQSSKGKRVLLP